MFSDPTYLPGRAAQVVLRPKPSIPAQDLAEPTPSTSKAGPLESVVESLKAALPLPSKASGSSDRDFVIGTLGILHPSVLAKFELGRPCSSLEIDIEPLL